MIPNTTDRNGISWVRCPECGDSRKHPNKAHCMIDDKGSSYCFLCGHSTQLTIGALMAIALGDITIDEALDLPAEDARSYTPDLWKRGTVLDQYAIDGRPNWVSYEMRDPNGKHKGWHNRNMRVKESSNEGRRGVGFAGDALRSSEANPLIVVEGPADVLNTRHACVFGTITRSVMKNFRLQYLWLFPDPDCLDSRMKRQRFIDLCTEIQEEYMIFVQGVIVANGDPDECTKQIEVPFYDLKKLMQLQPLR